MSKTLSRPTAARRPAPPSPAPAADGAARRAERWASLAAWPVLPDEGFTAARLDALLDRLAAPQQALADAAGLHVRTLQRRRAAGGLALTGHAADALLRVERLFGMAAHVFGSDAAAAAWFAHEQAALGTAPLQAVATEGGARAVEQVLGALEFGFAA